MRDPFRPDKNTQLIREAQIGLSVVAIMLSLFLYVAFYKIAGRGRHIPEHVRNAPIAETVYAEMPPANEVAMTPKRYLEERKTLGHGSSQTHQISQARPTFDPDQSFANSIAKKTEPNPSEFPRVASNYTGAENTKIPDVPISKKSLADRLSNFVSGYGQKKGLENLASSSHDPVAKLKQDSPANNLKPQHDFKTKDPTTATDSSVKLASGESIRSKKETHGFSASSDAASPRLNQNSFSPVPQPNLGDTKNRSVAPLPQQPSSSSDFKPLPKPTNSLPITDGVGELKVESNSFELSPLREPSAGREPSAAHEPAESVKSEFQLDSARSTIESPKKSDLSFSRADDASFLGLDSATRFNPPLHDGSGPSIKAPQPIAYRPNNLPTRLPHQRLPMPSETKIASVPNALREPNLNAQKNNFSLRADSEQALTNQPIQTLTRDSDSDPSPPVQQIAPSKEHPQSHVAREGESFWSIASDIYDDPRFFHALFKVNETATASFEQLDPGTKLQTPTQTELIRLWPELCPRDDSELGPDGELASDVATRFYVTKEGETLFGIAGRVLNQKSRYLEIYHANQVRLDSLADLSQPLPAGTRLVLPRQ